MHGHLKYAAKHRRSYLLMRHGFPVHVLEELLPLQHVQLSAQARANVFDKQLQVKASSIKSRRLECKRPHVPWHNAWASAPCE